jgi:GT2 family glycosyltransferase
LKFDNYEVLVVDGSNISLSVRNAEECLKYGARYIYRPRLGLSAARNEGIKESKGEIVAFTDDDCIVDRLWLEYLVKNFNRPNVACCTGRTVAYFTDFTDPLSLLFEKYYGFDRGSLPKVFNASDVYGSGFASLIKAIPHVTKRRITAVAPAPFSIGLGNNMAFRREVFNEVGYFDERLGRGTPSEAGEEIDMFYRILKAGKAIVYEPRAVVFHKHRQTIKEVVHAVYTCGTGVSAFLKKHIKAKDPRAFVYYVGRLINLSISSLSYHLLHKRATAKLAMVELKGWIKGVFKY